MVHKTIIHNTQPIGLVRHIGHIYTVFARIANKVEMNCPLFKITLLWLYLVWEWRHNTEINVNNIVSYKSILAYIQKLTVHIYIDGGTYTPQSNTGACRFIAVHNLYDGRVDITKLKWQVPVQSTDYQHLHL